MSGIQVAGAIKIARRIKQTGRFHILREEPENYFFFEVFFAAFFLVVFLAAGFLTAFFFAVAMMTISYLS